MIAYEKDGSRRPSNSPKLNRVAGAIVFAHSQADTGTVVAEVCRKMGISEATFYNWNRGRSVRSMVVWVFLSFDGFANLKK